MVTLDAKASRSYAFVQQPIKNTVLGHKIKRTNQFAATLLFLEINIGTVIIASLHNS